jgi:CubicO group peptidase (beta-lactamase class C family)
MALFRNLQPSEPFRSHWVYSNIGYAAVGEIASAVGGRPWEELLTKRIIRPLGMSRTTDDYEAVPSMGNYAWGHVEVAGRQQPIPRGSERLSTAAAGAVHSCARDLATSMLFQLGDGSFAGKRVISAESMEEMHSPEIFVPTTPEFRAARQLQRFAAYGLGWQIFDYRGHLMLWHSGNGDGQSAYLLLLPEDNLALR